MPDYFNPSGEDLLPSIPFWKMSWIFMIDSSGSMKSHAIDTNGLALDVKDAVSRMLKEIETVSGQYYIRLYIRIINFNDSSFYAVGNREHW